MKFLSNLKNHENFGKNLKKIKKPEKTRKKLKNRVIFKKVPKS